MDEFSTRLIQLLEFLNIKPVELAEKMGVQRTSFNHLLSGRNKPGFEFLVKLQTVYPTLNLNWLITGNGPITIDSNTVFSQPEIIQPEATPDKGLFSNIFNPPSSLISPKEEAQESPGDTEQEIDRLIIVYKNGKMVEVKH